MSRPLTCPPELLSLDLTGKTFIVTGGNSGIGLVTVRHLASQGARVVLACRRLDEGHRVRRDIMARGIRGRVDVAMLDLASLASVRAFAEKVQSDDPALHGLINNAAVMNTPPGRTADGFETQFGTNHLGHYLLTELLLPALRRGAPSRVITLSSCAHDIIRGRRGEIDFDDLQYQRRTYDGWDAYAQSKLANLLHARHLAARLSGTGVVTASVHPGWVRTRLVQSFMPVWVQDYPLRPFFRMAGILEPWEGTQTTLFALLSPTVEAQSGAYFSQRGWYRDRSLNGGGWPLHSPNPRAHDEDAAARLDHVSRRLVGLAQAF
jgi:NAD(P)-dependent dehydrogenase (short-subunit alcohol dehydrogenase family)